MHSIFNRVPIGYKKASKYNHRQAKKLSKKVTSSFDGYLTVFTNLIQKYYDRLPMNYKEVFTYRGVECKVMRSPAGNFNGYITLNINDDEVTEVMYGDMINYTPHGGWTYAERESTEGITFGFDTSHVGDVIGTYFLPEMRNFKQYKRSTCETFKTKEYVIREIKKTIDSFRLEELKKCLH